MSSISQFITHHYRHFNAAALVDAAKGYVDHLNRDWITEEAHLMVFEEML